MNIVTSKGKKFDIDTAEGAEAYLRSEGCDVDNLVANGLIEIWKLKKKLNEGISKRSKAERVKP